MEAQGRQWGTTPPVSTALPTDKELALNDALVADLKSQNNFEAPEDTEKRYSHGSGLVSTLDRIDWPRTVVLRSLQKITVEFVKMVGKKKGMPQMIINDAGGKIFTFGSYRLGVFGPGQQCIESVNVHG